MDRMGPSETLEEEEEAMKKEQEQEERVGRDDDDDIIIIEWAVFFSLKVNSTSQLSVVSCQLSFTDPTRWPGRVPMGAHPPIYACMRTSIANGDVDPYVN
jgi:hypothetical protein